MLRSHAGQFPGKAREAGAKAACESSGFEMLSSRAPAGSGDHQVRYDLILFLSVLEWGAGAEEATHALIAIQTPKEWLSPCFVVAFFPAFFVCFLKVVERWRGRLRCWGLGNASDLHM